jgi:hypothetical protein
MAACTANDACMAAIYRKKGSEDSPPSWPHNASHADEAALLPLSTFVTSNTTHLLDVLGADCG